MFLPVFIPSTVFSFAKPLNFRYDALERCMNLASGGRRCANGTS